MITASFGMLAHFRGTPAASAVALFAFRAVLGISVIEAVASRGFRRRPKTHPGNVVLLGTSVNFLSVGVALAAVYGAGALVPGVAVWLIAPLVAAGLYIVSEGAELAFAERVEAQVFSEQQAESEE